MDRDATFAGKEGGLFQVKTAAATRLCNEDIETGKVVSEAKVGTDVVIEVAEDTTTSDIPNEDSEDSLSVCRICSLSTPTADLINLGCDCKLDLGQAHTKCATTWFLIKGNSDCEICGKRAKNMQAPALRDPSMADDPIYLQHALSLAQSYDPNARQSRRFAAPNNGRAWMLEALALIVLFVVGIICIQHFIHGD